MIKWSDAAKDDLAGNLSYFVAKGEEPTGNKTVAQIYKAAGRLKSSPFSGRPGDLDGTREIVISKIPYIIIYAVLDKNNTEVLRVMHTARQRQPSEEEGQNNANH